MSRVRILVENMSKKPSLSLYSGLPLFANSNLDINLAFSRYSPEMHFMLEGLESYFNSLEGYSWQKNKPSRHASLSKGSLRLSVPFSDFARAFYGFTDSLKLSSVFGEMVDSEEDYRSQQILSILSSFDKEAKFVYVGCLAEPCLFFRKKDAEQIKPLLPKRFFKGVSRRDICVNKFTPLRSSYFPGRKQSYFATLPLVRGKVSELEDLQQIFSDEGRPIYLVDRSNYEYGGIGNYALFPPEDVAQIKCFPYKNQRHRDFFEGEEDERLPKDVLKDLAAKINNSIRNLMVK